MLTKLSIQNFKGIGSFEIEDLARVNLLIGKNDSGKSTIMEAIYYLFHELYAPPSLSEVMSRRTNLFTGISELWFGYKTESEIVVSVTFGSTDLCWKISAADPRGDSFNSLFYQRLAAGAAETGLGGTNYKSNFSVTSTTGIGMIGRIQADQNTKKELFSYAAGVAFVDCTLKSNTVAIERTLGKLKITGKDAKFGGILDDVYGKGKEWEFMPHPEDPDAKRLALRESGQLRYFSDFGDGMRCCVGILGTSMVLENTAIFIEEVESHQHSGSLNKLVGHLIKISRDNNLQIFLSTHSMDVWGSLHRGVYAEDETKEKEEFRCFLIERNAETGKVSAEHTYDVQKITKALE